MILNTVALTFDDVCVVPQYSNILPAGVDTKTKLTKKINLNIPLISAAMDTVTESRMAISLAQEGGIGIIHKNMSVEEQANMVRVVKRHESGIVHDPVSIYRSYKIRKVRELILKNGFSSFPVVSYVETSKPILVGLVTSRDLQFAPDDDAEVETIMTPASNLFVGNSSIPKELLIEMMIKHKVEKLPIVDNDFVLVGLITLKDSLKSKKFPNSCRDKNGSLIVGAAVGVGCDGLERMRVLVEAGVDVVVVDTAHGHSQGVLSAVSNIKSIFPDLQVIAGNVVTASAAYDLCRAGVDAVKVGVGPGSICTTRIVSGAGMPQLSAIIDVASKSSVPVICDGGIRYSGDITKAIIAGADAVMIGGLFAGTDESPGEIDLYQGRSYKSYRGMGSLGAMQQMHGSKDRYFQDGVDGNKLVPEGIEGRVPCSGPVSSVIHQLIGGLRSGMGYSGAKNIEELKANGKMIQITNSGVRESHVHDVQIVKESPNYSFGDR